MLNLPVEVLKLFLLFSFINFSQLLYEIHLDALNPGLPLTCKSLYSVFRSSPASYRAQYITKCVHERHKKDLDRFYTFALRFPCINTPTLDILLKSRPFDSIPIDEPTDLPRHLFRHLKSAADSSPIPFLQDLAERLPFLDLNANRGYALTRAVHAQFIPLVRWLLQYGADPGICDGSAVLVAIYRRNIQLVRMLVDIEQDQDIEHNSTPENTKGYLPKRPIPRRTAISKEMLKAAAKCESQDIIEYFVVEKKCMPDVETIAIMKGWKKCMCTFRFFY